MNINIKDGEEVIIDCTEEEAAFLGSLFLGLSVSDNDIAKEIKEEFAKHIRAKKRRRSI